MNATLHDLHRPLGSTGLSISPLGLGTVKLGRDQGVKYPSGFAIPDDDQARQLLTLARELGINLIDTAPAYGVSEERLGPLLAGQREDWVIVSKVGEEFENGQSRFDFSATHTRLSVERSLKRLRTDRIELVLVHSDGNDLDILQHTEVYQTLAELKREGKILAFGQDPRLRPVRQDGRWWAACAAAGRLRDGDLQPQRAGRTTGPRLRCCTRQGHPDQESPGQRACLPQARRRPGPPQFRAAVRSPRCQRRDHRHYQSAAFDV